MNGRRHFTQAEVTNIITLYNEGKSINYLRIANKCSDSGIRKLLTKAGITTRGITRQSIPPSQDGNKKCASCKEILPINLFYTRKNCLTGLSSYCKDCMWKRKLKILYGYSWEEYQVLLLAQGGVCAICKLLHKTERLVVDHDHSTGKVRGLLCSPCNKGLGAFKDKSEILNQASLYLIKSLE